MPALLGTALPFAIGRFKYTTPGKLGSSDGPLVPKPNSQVSVLGNLVTHRRWIFNAPARAHSLVPSAGLRPTSRAHYRYHSYGSW